MSLSRDPLVVLSAQTDALERQLRERHPQLAAYLDMTILTRPMFGGGWDMCGETFASEPEADEARRAAVMLKLIEADRNAP